MQEEMISRNFKVSPEVWNKLKSYARANGFQLYKVVNEAFRNFVSEVIDKEMK